MHVYTEAGNTDELVKTLARFLESEPRAILGFQKKGTETISFWVDSDPEPDPKSI